MLQFKYRHLGCDCPNGYVGPICEFKDLQIEPEECKLSCMNDGICRKGVKDISNLKKYGILNRNRNLNDADNLDVQYNDDFEHCVCPIGYVGLQCEHKLDICPGGEHACLNGGDCITTIDKNNNNQINYECNCDDAVINDTRYAGEFCEMQSTEYCTIDKQIPLGGDAINAFCTNGGTCKGYVHINEV